MPKCKYYAEWEGTCTNGHCPACADFCPCADYPEICLYSDTDAETDGEPEADP